MLHRFWLRDSILIHFKARFGSLFLSSYHGFQRILHQQVDVFAAVFIPDIEDFIKVQRVEPSSIYHDDFENSCFRFCLVFCRWQRVELVAVGEDVIHF